MKPPLTPQTTSSGNRLEQAPVASRGRFNSHHLVWVGPDHDVQWIMDHDNLGHAVVGYKLVRKDGKPDAK